MLFMFDGRINYSWTFLFTTDTNHTMLKSKILLVTLQRSLEAKAGFCYFGQPWISTVAQSCQLRWKNKSEKEPLPGKNFCAILKNQLSWRKPLWFSRSIVNSYSNSKWDALTTSLSFVDLTQHFAPARLSTGILWI